MTALRQEANLLAKIVKDMIAITEEIKNLVGEEVDKKNGRKTFA